MPREGALVAARGFISDLVTDENRVRGRIGFEDRTIEFYVYGTSRYEPLNQAMQDVELVYLNGTYKSAGEGTIAVTSITLE